LTEEWAVEIAPVRLSLVSCIYSLKSGMYLSTAEWCVVLKRLAKGWDKTNCRSCSVTVSVRCFKVVAVFMRVVSFLFVISCVAFTRFALLPLVLEMGEPLYSVGQIRGGGSSSSVSPWVAVPSQLMDRIIA
jgi:hypothetical protein